MVFLESLLLLTLFTPNLSFILNVSTTKNTLQLSGCITAAVEICQKWKVQICLLIYFLFTWRGACKTDMPPVMDITEIIDI